MLVRKRLEPRHVRSRQLGCVNIKRVPGGLVIIGIIHPACDGGVVVAEDRHFGDRAHEIGAFVRACTITDHVSEAVALVDPLLRNLNRAFRA